WEVDKEGRGIGERALGYSRPKCFDRRITQPVQHHQRRGDRMVAPCVGEGSIWDVKLMDRCVIHTNELNAEPRSSESTGVLLRTSVVTGTRGERRRTSEDRSNWSSSH